MTEPVPSLDPLPSPARPVAYFCFEYGLEARLPLYSGGLGVLAGDHLKSADDLDVPLVAVGLFYRHGYMTQTVDADGNQVAGQHDNDPVALGMAEVRDDRGRPIQVELPLGDETLRLRAWLHHVGDVALYLLDADFDGNPAELRTLTHALYAGDSEHRIRQEIALGIGGVRLLRALGIEPSVWHMNEGHAAFLTLERARELVVGGLDFDAARAEVSAGTVFTTHTPVPAGHDRFGEDLIERYLGPFLPELSVSLDQLLALGRVPNPDPAEDTLNMTLLALSFSAYRNGVSRKHGEVSRELLRDYWPELEPAQVPIDAITNGVHLPTWTAAPLAAVLGAAHRPVRGEDFARVAQTTDTQLWSVRRAGKQHLAEVVEASIRRRGAERGDPQDLIDAMCAGLADRDALWIGFARRFAAYKRGDLVLGDPDALAELLDHATGGARLLFAGKAHPRDEAGQAVMRNVFLATRSPRLRGRVFFLEGYDMELARCLVQGVDIWLNTPERDQEASGTSGMKAVANGALHVSIADGWWPEAANGDNGWTIAADHDDDDDDRDRAELLALLDQEILPLYARRAADGIPHDWLQRVRASLASIPARFDSARMVRDYVERAYRPLAQRPPTLRPEPQPR